MIVVEEKLSEVFNQLPLVDGMTPYYDWGDENNLDKLVKLKPDCYPLIYQTSKKEDHNLGSGQVRTYWTAVIAVSNKQGQNLVNNERWALAFRNVLNPLSEKIIESFEMSGFTIIDDKISISRYGNYGENANFTIDIWDAILFECDLLIPDNCVGTLVFN